MLKNLFTKRSGPIWGVLAATALVLACLSFTPMRAWAERMLGLFRVKKIAVVSIDPTRFRSGGDQFARQIGQLLSDNVVVTKEPREPRIVTNTYEASELAGFSVRLPSSRVDLQELKVQDDQSFQMTIDLARLQAILDEAGPFDLQLPASLDRATVVVEIPKGVLATYGHCPERGRGKYRQPGDWSDCVVLVQIPSPTVVTPPDLNLAQIAQIGLQLAGMSEEEARAFSQSVDWASTLVVPVPIGAATYEMVEVDGVKGTFISPTRREGRPNVHTLLWVKNGIIYCLTASGDLAEALSLANSLE